MSGIIGQLISSLTIVLIDWQAVFFLFGAIYLIAAIMLYLILQKDEMERENRNFVMIMKHFQMPFKQTSLLISFCIGVTLLLCFIGMYTALENYLAIHFGFTAEETFYVRAAGIFGIILAPFTGKFSQIFGLKRVLYTGFLSGIIGLIGVGFSTNLFLSIFMSITFVAGIALIVPSMLALTGQLGGKQRGPATAVYTFFMFAGASLGPIMATLLFDTGNPNLPFFIFADTLLIGTVLVRFLNPSPTK